MIRTEGVVADGPEPSMLRIESFDLASPSSSEVLVSVAASGLNRADILQRKGRYPAPPSANPRVLGLEYAGVVERVGDAVSSVRPGDAVMGIVAGAGMARHVVVHERELMPVPRGVSLANAAAIPEVFMTAYDALFVRGRLGVGETVLIHAVASGVGTAAAQLSRAVSAVVVGTSRSVEKLAQCAPLGVDHGVVAEADAFAEGVTKAVGRDAVDLVIDTVGASYLEQNLDVLRVRGRLVVVGLLGGDRASLSLGKLIGKRITMVGTVLRSRPIEEKIELAQRVRRDLVPLFESGALVPVVDVVLPMTRIADAHRRMETGAHVGKIVLSWS